MNTEEMQVAFENVFDQAVLFHGFTDYMRDYDIFIHASADPKTGIAPVHFRYRFKYCVSMTANTALTPGIWKRSLDDRLIDYDQGVELDGYVWGVKWQDLYPGFELIADSAKADQWSNDLGVPFYEVTVGTNGHNLNLIFSDLEVETVPVGYAPFNVPDN